MPVRVFDVQAAAELVPDGASVGITSPPPMALVRALIRRGARDLHLVGVPTGGLAADLLIGAGCVRSLEASAVQIGEAGFAPQFSDAVQAGTLAVRDST
jgi:glutaconate CoA-transferase, subunit A